MGEHDVISTEDSHKDHLTHHIDCVQVISNSQCCAIGPGRSYFHLRTKSFTIEADDSACLGDSHSLWPLEFLPCNSCTSGSDVPHQEQIHCSNISIHLPRQSTDSLAQICSRLAVQTPKSAHSRIT